MGNDTINKLKESYVSGGKGRKISDEDVEKIGAILVKDFVNQGKKFTTRIVAGLMEKNGIGDYSENKNPEHARLNGAYGILVRLQIIEKKVKKTPEA